MTCTLQALQYKTDQIADVKKIEKLNLLFFTLMAQGSEADGAPQPALCLVYWVLADMLSALKSSFDLWSTYCQYAIAPGNLGDVNVAAASHLCVLCSAICRTK